LKIKTRELADVYRRHLTDIEGPPPDVCVLGRDGVNIRRDIVTHRRSRICGIGAAIRGRFSG
jgi:hypothetical protein